MITLHLEASTIEELEHQILEVLCGGMEATKRYSLGTVYRKFQP